MALPLIIVGIIYWVSLRCVYNRFGSGSSPDWYDHTIYLGFVSLFMDKISEMILFLALTWDSPTLSCYSWAHFVIVVEHKQRSCADFTFYFHLFRLFCNVANIFEMKITVAAGFHSVNLTSSLCIKQNQLRVIIGLLDRLGNNLQTKKIEANHCGN